MFPLRQSTSAGVPVLLRDPSTGAPVSGVGESDIATVDIWKAGTATPVDISSIQDFQSGADGIFYVSLNASATDTLGPLVIVLVDSQFQPVRQECVVMPANVYDSLYGTDQLQVDVVQVSGDSTAADNLEAAYDGGGYDHAGNTYAGVALAADQSQVTNLGAHDISTSEITVTFNDAVPANVVSTDPGAITEESLDAGLLTQEKFAEDVSLGGGPPAAVLQHDIDRDFIFRFRNREAGGADWEQAINVMRMTKNETPRFGYEVSPLTRVKPGQVVSVEVLRDGEASTDLVVADQEDTENCGVRDFLVMTKVDGCEAAGTYTVRLTFATIDGPQLIVEGTIEVKALTGS